MMFPPTLEIAVAPMEIEEIAMAPRTERVTATMSSALPLSSFISTDQNMRRDYSSSTKTCLHVVPCKHNSNVLPWVQSTTRSWLSSDLS